MAKNALQTRGHEDGALSSVADGPRRAELVSGPPARGSASNLRVWVGASSGGHLAELLELTARSERWCPHIDGLMTTLPVGLELERRFERVQVIGDCNRRTWWRGLAVAFRSWSAVRGARPHVFITTGSMPMLFVAAAVKLQRGRVIWIDSVARVDGLSMSAWVARGFVDLCLTQWPYVASQYRGVDYAGEVF